MDERRRLTMRTRSLLAGAALALFAVAGCTQGSQPPPSPGRQGGATGGAPGSARQAGLVWHPCGNSDSRLRCPRRRVPRNYHPPDGRKITLALSEVPATAPPGQRKGVLLVNPGGPGGSGLSLAPFVAQGLSSAVAARYDIVGFDTRGVGASQPALHCDRAFFAGDRPNYIPANAAAEQVLVGRARAYAAACQQKYGGVVPDITPANIPRDIEQNPAAMGEGKRSYLRHALTHSKRPGACNAVPCPGELTGV